MKFDLDKYGSADVFRWHHDHLVRVLTTGSNKIVSNPKLIQALKLLKREDFVPKEFKDEAYSDREIEIGFGQKLNRPTATLQMLQLLNLKPGDYMLDIGTGTGWSAALAAYVVAPGGRVVSVEKYQYILDQARKNIAKYKELNNIELVFKDASKGLAERAPFDAIHIGAALSEVPDIIKEQLKIGGRLIYPNKERKVIVLRRLGVDKWKETSEWIDEFDDLEEGIN